jgi:CRISPR type I-E-associated protein CasB/Cse2
VSQTDDFVKKLEALKDKHGELSILRGLAGKRLDETLPGFDLFTGLWWPLRQKSPRTPSRETSWLVAKLFGAFPIKHVRSEQTNGLTLAEILGRVEPVDEHGRPRFRTRFDALLCASISTIEPHLCWALSQVDDAVVRGRVPGLDWVELLDDLWKWEKGSDRDARDKWAGQYLTTTNEPKGSTHVN